MQQVVLEIGQIVISALQKNIGVPFKVPEDVFPLEHVKKAPIHRIEKEIVIMIGYPGSGKSTIAKDLEPLWLLSDRWRSFQNSYSND